MTASLRLPAVLSSVTGSARAFEVEGDDLAAALSDLFGREPGLRGHVLDEGGEVRPHVSIFVDGDRAGLDARVGEGSEIWIIQAVSGGNYLSGRPPGKSA